VWGTDTAFLASWNNDLPRASAAGAKFAKAVLAFANWVGNPQNHSGNDYNRQSVFGGIDIEEDPSEGWSNYPVVRAFLSGYTSVTSHRPLVNFGALTTNPLCESDSASSTCTFPGRGWTGDHVAATNRQPLAASACPQVYSHDQIRNWLGLENALGANTSVHKWGGDPIYFSCVLAGDTFLGRQDAWTQFVGGIAAQKRMNFFAKKITQIDTLSAAGKRLYTNGASIPLP
jgi:hypothetical protein